MHGGGVSNDPLWDGGKSSAEHCGEVRAILDAHANAIVAEIAGDLNKEVIFAAGERSWGVPAGAEGPSTLLDDRPHLPAWTL